MKSLFNKILSINQSPTRKTLVIAVPLLILMTFMLPGATIEAQAQPLPSPHWVNTFEGGCANQGRCGGTPDIGNGWHNSSGCGQQAYVTNFSHGGNDSHWYEVTKAGEFDCPAPLRYYPTWDSSISLPVLVTFWLYIGQPAPGQVNQKTGQPLTDWEVVAGDRFSQLTLKEQSGGGNMIGFTTHIKSDGSMDCGHCDMSFQATAGNVPTPMGQWHLQSAYLEEKPSPGDDFDVYGTFWIDDRVAVEGKNIYIWLQNRLRHWHMGLYADRNGDSGLFEMYNDDIKIFAVSDIQEAAALIGQELGQGPVETCGHGSSQVSRFYNCQETVTPECSNGLDDDNDGSTDFPADPDCTGPNDTSESPPPPPPVCGNGLVETGEQCDGSVGSQTCQSRGFTGGTLACYAPGTANECNFDVSNCTTGGGGACSTTFAAGDRVVATQTLNVRGTPGGQPLFGTQPTGATGTVAAGSEIGQGGTSCWWPINWDNFTPIDCSATLCWSSETSLALESGGPVCGNGLVEAGEQCDGSVGSQTCQSLPGYNFTGGQLSCYPVGTANECNFDITNCTIAAGGSPCGGALNQGGPHTPDLNVITTDIGDGCVDAADLAILLSCWGATPTSHPNGCPAAQLPTQDLSLSVAPSSRAISKGDTAQYDVTIQSLGGLAGNVDFQFTGCPGGGTTCTYVTTSCNLQADGTCTTTFNVSNTANTPAGSHTLSLTATHAQASKAKDISLIVGSGPPGPITGWNHDYPRLAFQHFGQSPAEWIAKFDLVIKGNQQSRTPEVRAIDPSTKWVFTRQLSMDNTWIPSNCPRWTDAWWAVDGSGARIPRGNWDLVDMSDLTQTNSQGEHYYEYIPECLAEFSMNWPADGVGTDWFWDRPFNISDLDLDRNGVNDYDEHGAGFVNNHWASGIELFVANWRAQVNARNWGATGSQGGPETPIWLNSGRMHIDRISNALTDSNGLEFEKQTGFNNFNHIWNNYKTWINDGRKPSVWVTDARPDNSAASRSRRGHTKNALEHMRMFLTFTLMGDGYFEHNPFECHEHLCYDYFDEYDVALGWPTSDAHRLGNDIMVRFFDNGAAIMNPNNSPVVISDSDISGLTGYAGPYYRFLGGQTESMDGSSSMNNGTQFTTLTLAGRTGASNRAIGDGVVLVKQPTTVVADIIIDNMNHFSSSGSDGAVLNGAWSERDKNSGNFAANGDSWSHRDKGGGGTSFYSHATAASGSGATAVFTPNIGVPGTYEVYAWNASLAGGGEATNVTYTINLPGSGPNCTSSGNTTTCVRDQKIGQGQWISLGDYSFAAGEGQSVTLGTAGASGIVIADAIKFVYRGP